MIPLSLWLYITPANDALLFSCAQSCEKMMGADNSAFWYLHVATLFVFASLAVLFMYVKIQPWVGNAFVYLPRWASTFHYPSPVRCWLHDPAPSVDSRSASSLEDSLGCHSTLTDLLYRVSQNRLDVLQQVCVTVSAFSPYPEQLVSIVSTLYICIRLIIIPKGGTIDQRQGCTV